MGILQEDAHRLESILEVARKMMLAARTAPKARGRSNLHMLVIYGRELDELARVMNQMGEQHDNEIFFRDARNVRDHADAMLIMGTQIQTMGLKLCGLCGFESCDEKLKFPGVPCVFNTGDLGIAVGSAVAAAALYHVDNRIMYTAGMAARELKLPVENCPVVYGIPLSASSKNPFFDRKL